MGTISAKFGTRSLRLSSSEFRDAQTEYHLHCVLDCREKRKEMKKYIFLIYVLETEGKEKNSFFLFRVLEQKRKEMKDVIL